MEILRHTTHMPAIVKLEFSTWFQIITFGNDSIIMSIIITNKICFCRMPS